MDSFLPTHCGRSAGPAGSPAHTSWPVMNRLANSLKGLLLRRQRGCRLVCWIAWGIAFLPGVVDPLAVHSASISWVPIGNPGNPTPEGGIYGSVNFEYWIMPHECTNAQYTEFLNAIDPDGLNPNAVYNTDMGSDPRGGIAFNAGASAGSKYTTRTNMANKPVLFVSWFDAARMANWLQGGAQTYGSTDASASGPQNVGAYTLGTATTGSAPAANGGAQYSIPTENQWYKAAYYTGSGNAYRSFGNGFSLIPTAVTANATGDGSAGATGIFANYNAAADWNGQDGNVTTVGTNGFPSDYGVFDMSGNAMELNSLAGTTSATVGLRGGHWLSADPNEISSAFRVDYAGPSGESAVIGFRLVTVVPEPTGIALLGLGAAGVAVWRVRRRLQAEV